LRHPQRSSFSANNRPVFQGTDCLNPPLEGEGRSEAPGWGDLRHMRLTMVLAVVTPTRRAAATSPLKGEVTLRHPQRSSFSATNRPVFQGTVCLNPPLEGEGRSEAPGWGDLRHMRLTMVLAVVTPTRRAAATSPLKGEVTLRHPQRSSFSATNRPVFQGTDCLNPPLEGEGRSKAPGWGELRRVRLTMALAVVTPTRRAAANSPLKGEVDFPLPRWGEEGDRGFCNAQ
jgi:hypothetical protein